MAKPLLYWEIAGRVAIGASSPFRAGRAHSERSAVALREDSPERVTDLFLSVRAQEQRS